MVQVFAKLNSDNTKRPNVVFQENSTRPKRWLSCGTGGGPHDERSQMQQSRNRGRLASRRIASATKVKVGACGTKLLKRALISTMGRPVYSFPSGSPFNSPQTLNCGKSQLFLLRKGRPRAVGSSKIPREERSDTWNLVLITLYWPVQTN